MKSKLSYYIDIFKTILREPSRLYAVLNPPMEDGRFSENYVRSTHGIKKLPEVLVTDLFPHFGATLKHYSYLEGTSLIIDIALLMAFAKRFEACQYFEIGTWRGESAANLATVSSKVTSLTLSAEDLKNLGFDEKLISTQGFYLKDLENVEVCFGDSTTYDFGPFERSYDLVFIDGDHRKESVESDSRNALKLLKDDRSVIVWHDYGWNTERVRYNTLAGILDGIPKDQHQYLYHVANTKCAIFTREPIEGMHLGRYENPKVNFEIAIEGKKI